MATQSGNVPDFSELMQLANSDPGKQLLNLLQQQETGDLRSALKTGDYLTAKEMIAAMLDTPEAQALVKQLREK